MLRVITEIVHYYSYYNSGKGRIVTYFLSQDPKTWILSQSTVYYVPANRAPNCQSQQLYPDTLKAEQKSMTQIPFSH